MESTRAIRVGAPGGPEVLQLTEIPLAPPTRGQARVRQTAIGLNFIDIYQRSGLYPLGPDGIPGCEAAGVIESIGEGVTTLRAGDRVAYALRSPGAYVERRNVPAGALVPLPDWLDDHTAAATLLKGMTAEYLVRRTFPVQRGQWIVLHAAAGATGLLVAQWAHAEGARVIGVVSSDEKASLARAHGCEAVVVTPREALADRVREITGGTGAAVVYDSVGQATLAASFDCLAPRGTVVLFGQSSGPVTSFDPAVLARGSYFLTRPSLFAYIATRDELLSSAGALFERLRDRRVRVHIENIRMLADAADAHRALQERCTTGATVLVP